LGALPRGRSFKLAAIAVTVVIGLAGCGSSKVPAVQWATTVCSAVRPWRTQITALNAQAQQQVSSASSPVQVRDSLVSLLDGGAQASEQARAAVAGAGIPDVGDGAAVASRFADSLTKVRDAYRHARTDLESLSITDASSFYDGVVAVLTKLQSEYATSALDTSNLDAPALQEAFDGVDQCR
jgi:hypothetical protein